MQRPTLFVLPILMLLAIRCSQPDQWQPVSGDIMTRWAKNVNPNHPLPEYPRPQFVRSEWLNLNGLWDFAIRPREQSEPDSFDGKILVPYPVESALSGVKKMVGEQNQLWYRRQFEVPSGWKNRKIMLHFGAVDWQTRVWVNGKEIGLHRGGYDAFSFDITSALNSQGPQEILISVWDPIDSSYQPRGKQVQQPGGIWYTSVTGIWQTVWLEPVPEIFIQWLKITPNIDNNEAHVQVFCSSTRPNYRIQLKVKDRGKTISKAEGLPFDELIAKIDHPKLWSPESPFLYDIEIALLDDQGRVIDKVLSYLGMRKIDLGKDEQGITRIFLNNQPIFMHGLLDQGWWPDGLYTAPTDEALKYDIEITKQLGFNTIRKHVKVEPERWYYWCDRLGVLVWQDMPSGDEYIGTNDPDLKRSEASALQYKAELKAMITGRYNHPCIVMWVPFNEGWGQFETDGITRWIKNFDPGRLVNSASGWSDRGCGDVNDIHRYPGPGKPANEPNRAAVLGEYGGLGLAVAGHTWREENNWGYRGYQTAHELTMAYEELTRQLLPLIPQGLCGAIYTQTTDVEVEVNGMMTYDREVIKMNPELVRMINRGYFSPQIVSDDEIFLDQARIEMITAKGGETRYTLDGSEPMRNSPLYEKPIVLSTTTTVKARTFWSDGSKSLISSFRCEKVALTEPVQVENTKPGLLVRYYQGEWDRLPDFGALEPIFSRTVYAVDLKTAQQQENYALVFDGFIGINQDGVYTFFVTSDDGSRLWIDDKPIVDNDGLHGMIEASGKIALKSGMHRFTLHFFQKRGGSGLEVQFKAPGIEKQPLPSSILFH